MFCGLMRHDQYGPLLITTAVAKKIVPTKIRIAIQSETTATDNECLMKTQKSQMALQVMQGRGNTSVPAD